MKRMAIAMLPLLASCASGGKPALPPTQPVPLPTIIEVPVEVYVPIDRKLLAKCPWKRDVLPSESMSAAKERGLCAEDYERKLEAIGKVQGKPMPAATDTPTQVAP